MAVESPEYLKIDVENFGKQLLVQTVLKYSTFDI